MRGKLHRTARRAAGAWLLPAALIPCCAPALQPCRSPSVCSENEECLAQRCVPIGAEPVDPGSRRVVLEPLQVAVVRKQRGAAGGLPASVTFGGPSAQNEQLLLRFPEAWAEGDVSAAFLLLRPAPSALPSAADVPLDVALAADGWSPGTTNEAPSTRAPHGAGVGRTRPPATLRIDVTALLRELASQPGQDGGFLVRAREEGARGAVYSTGAEGLAPRLDVYFRPRPSPPRASRPTHVDPLAEPRARQ